jgi:hypothetical protein
VSGGSVDDMGLLKTLEVMTRRVISWRSALVDNEEGMDMVSVSICIRVRETKLRKWYWGSCPRETRRICCLVQNPLDGRACNSRVEPNMAGEREYMSH